MNYNYSQKIIELLQKVETINEESIEKLSDEFVRCIKEDKIIHTFGTGHSLMAGMELFGRAGGLGNIDCMMDPNTSTSFGAQRNCAIERVCGLSDIIYDNHRIEKGDIMIITSNSGRNAMPIEMAIRCKKENIYVVALTNLNQSINTTSRHPLGKNLYEYADLILDTCCPVGDALMNIEGIKTGACSNIVNMYLLDLVVVLTIDKCKKQGIKPFVFQSQNLDGITNDDIYAYFANRVKYY